MGLADLFADAWQAAPRGKPKEDVDIAARSQELVEALGGKAAQTWPARLAKSGLAALALPGDVYQGNVTPSDPAYYERAADLAGLVMGGGLPAAEKGAVGIFGGRLAKTADKAALARAEDMAGKGASREQIWNDTGWFQGADGKWRFEIPDNAATLKVDALPQEAYPGRYLDDIAADVYGVPDYLSLPPNSVQRKNVGTWADEKSAKQANATVPLTDALSHEALANAYDLGGMRIGRESGGGLYGSQTGDTIRVGGRPLISDTATPEMMRSTALHEMQHKVQDVEGFGRGALEANLRTPENARMQKLYDHAYLVANRVRTLGETPESAARYISGASDSGIAPDVLMTLATKYTPEQLQKLKMDYTPSDIYRRHAGEVEARNVQKRRDMGPSERRAAPPWTTEDVPTNQQIVTLGTGQTRQTGLAALPTLVDGGAEVDETQQTEEAITADMARQIAAMRMRGGLRALPLSR